MPASLAMPGRWRAGLYLWLYCHHEPALKRLLRNCKTKRHPQTSNRASFVKCVGLTPWFSSDPVQRHLLIYLWNVPIGFLWPQVNLVKGVPNVHSSVNSPLMGDPTSIHSVPFQQERYLVPLDLYAFLFDFK